MKVGDLVLWNGQVNGIIIERLIDRPAPPKYVGRPRKWFKLLTENGGYSIACQAQLEVINERGSESS